MDLKAEIRNVLGKKVKAIRKNNQIPAELYGHGINNLHLLVNAKDFKKALKETGENTILNLIVDNKTYPVLIQDVTNDDLTGQPINIDFYQVRLDEKVKVRVPIEFVGEAPATKEKNGILNKTMLDIEIEAFPKDLPRFIEADLSSLKEINSTLRVKDLKIPKGVTPTIDPETTVATIVEMAVEEEKPEKEISIEDVKVEAEEKKAEREKNQEQKEEAEN